MGTAPLLFASTVVLFFKRLLLGGLLALVLMPALQAKFHFFDEKPLGGAYTLGAHPDPTWDALHDNTYQTGLERYLEDRLGLRPFLIRLRNQLAFSLFRVVHASGTEVGRNGILFETFQIQSYAGHDRLAEAVVRARVRRLRTVQRDLARRGVQLLFVLAPNKARFQPEDLPARWQVAPGTVTNYDLYLRALQADTVTMLNLVPLLAQWKKTAPYPLFARAGTHWSGYGAALAVDTLLRRLEQLGGVHFPTVRTLGKPLVVRTTDSLQGNDNDLAKPLNLLQAVENTPHAYPQLAFETPQPGQTRPPALFVSDSFIWGFTQFNSYIPSLFSDDTRIWYYGNNVYRPDKPFTPDGPQVRYLNYRQIIESRRFIVLMTTEHNLVKREFDFTDLVYRLYHPLTPADNAAIDELAKRLAKQAIERNADAAWEAQAKDPNAYQAQLREQAEVLYENRL